MQAFHILDNMLMAVTSAQIHEFSKIVHFACQYKLCPVAIGRCRETPEIKLPARLLCIIKLATKHDRDVR
jgi:hypothetical protein